MTLCTRITIHGDDPSKWYNAWCGECEMEMPFTTARERATWWDKHVQATNHDLTVIDKEKASE